MDSEIRALRGSAIALLIVSSIRWLASFDHVDVVASTEIPIAALLDSSRIRAQDEDARNRPLRADESFDVNAATEMQFDRLPGIGKSTAERIVAYRTEHGPFRRLEELERVRGVGPNTLDRMRPHLVVAGHFDGPLTRRREVDSRVDINRADSASLVRLPGIGPALASRILAERGKQAFRSVDDLVRVRGVGPATARRLRPLVVVR